MIHTRNLQERDRIFDLGSSRYPALLACCLVLGACGKPDQGAPSSNAGSSARNDAPVAIDPDPPVVYPPSLFQQGIEGTVQLRLFVDEKGVVVPESTQVAESSGYAEFDSAAVAGVPRMHFAPAQHDGRPIATAFTQPVHFRRSQGGEKKP
ncbi:MAG: energy transducer TonB [Gemmatimonadota bacterium]